MEEKSWRAWVIKRNRFDQVVSFIKENCPEVDKFFYPYVKRKYKINKGQRIQSRPLYEGYIFLHYDNADEVFHKLRSCPFVTTFAGPVSEEEIVCMENLQGQLLSDIKVSLFVLGDTVRFLSGPFKDFEAQVVALEEDFIRVRVDARILGKDDIEVTCFEDQLEKKGELFGVEVQTI